MAKQKFNIKKIKFEDDEYPDTLKTILYPPEQLYVLGDEKLLKEKSISIIGSRVCSEKGAKIAQEFASSLSKMGICIISGMAKGIDTAAHIGALKYGGKTIAVLGGGFNNIFPKENEKLFLDIIKNGGAVVSEYDVNTIATSQRFVQRNRIVSGLSMGVLVVEAKARSGTSITADFATRQNKKVFCIAHGIEEREGVGTNRLIKKGAKLVTSVEDIKKELCINIDENVDKHIEKTINIVNVPKEYMPIYKYISDKPINVDELCKKTKLDIRKVNYILTMLELEGYIKKMPGNLITKNEI